MDDNDKVICRCRNITIENLREVVKKGAKSFEEVQTINNISTGCSKCSDSVKILIDELLKDQ